ncbi:MAG: NAD(P)/FAD-dependent oxidoreductase [Thermodesulfobacteriota bacterium]
MSGQKAVQVIIIGAGTGGLSTALELAGAGVKATVIEQRSEDHFGNTWCNDVEVTTFLAAGLPEPLDEHLAFRYDHPYFVRSRDGNVEYRIDGLKLYPLMMSKYQEHLKKMCRERGVAFLFDTEATGLLTENDAVAGVTIKNRDSGDQQNLSADMVVAACGDKAAIFKSLPGAGLIDLDIEDADYVFALQELWTVDRDRAARVMREKHIVDKGVICHVGVSGPYSILLYQLDLDRGRFGILSGTKIQNPGVSHPRRVMDEKIRDLGFCLEKTYAGGRHIPLRYPPFSMVCDGFAVVGDSAYMANPQNGSGTYTSMAAGKLLARTIANIIRTGSPFDTASLWEYNHRFHTTIGAQLAGLYVSQKITRGLVQDDVHKLLTAGVLRPKDIVDAYETRAVNLTVSDALGRFFSGLSVLPVLLKFTRNGLRVQQAVRHYRKFPETFDAAAFNRWKEKAAAIFRF